MSLEDNREKRQPSNGRPIANWLKAIRVHQWLKNLLVFVPALASHRIASLETVVQASLAFLSFSLCASAVYVINDLVDLKSDQAHHRKKSRPFASGAIATSRGFIAVPALLGASVLFAMPLPRLFFVVLLSYFFSTCIYSFWLKRQVVVDVMLLASLYTFRIIAGAASTFVFPSFWLLAFSMFLFLSLALIKRYSEMIVTQQQHKNQADGRGYLVSDSPILLSLGSSAAYSSVLVLALYINSPDLPGLYPNKWSLWLAVPPFLYWTTRVWLKAHRGELHDDPMVFAVTDKQSWLVLALIGAATYVAASSAIVI